MAGTEKNSPPENKECRVQRPRCLVQRPCKDQGVHCKDHAVAKVLSAETKVAECKNHGAQCRDLSVQCKDCGAQCNSHGAQCINQGAQCTDHGAQCRDQVCRVKTKMAEVHCVQKRPWAKEPSAIEQLSWSKRTESPWPQPKNRGGSWSPSSAFSFPHSKNQVLLCFTQLSLFLLASVTLGRRTSVGVS